jgi:hypothetical protein
VASIFSSFSKAMPLCRKYHRLSGMGRTLKVHTIYTPCKTAPNSTQMIHLREKKINLPSVRALSGCLLFWQYLNSGPGAWYAGPLPLITPSYITESHSDALQAAFYCQPKYHEAKYILFCHNDLRSQCYHHLLDGEDTYKQQ